VLFSFRNLIEPFSVSPFVLQKEDKLSIDAQKLISIYMFIIFFFVLSSFWGKE